MVKEKKKTILLPLWLSILLFPVHASSTNFTPGELTISGELVASACDIDPNSRELWVEFGNISARDIHMDEDGKIVRPFLVHLVGCSTLVGNDKQGNDSLATITFSGSASQHDSTVLIPDGDGEGFGIRLQDQRGEVLTFGQPSPSYVLSDDKNTLRFTASLVPIEEHIKAGEFYAVTRFFIDYN